MQGSPLLTEDAPAADTGVVVAPSALITGETPYLVTGVVAIAVVMILVLVMIGRWRVGARTREAARSTDFFQPAGEGAEITFDDSEPAAETFPMADEMPFPEPASKKKKSSPFPGLFAKRDKRQRDDAPELLDLSEGGEDFASVEIDRSPSADHQVVPEPAPVADWEAIEREARQRAEIEAEKAADEARRREEEAETRWRAMEVDRQQRLADENRRRAEREAAARLAAASDPYRAAPAPAAGNAAHDEIVRTLSEVEEALQVQREAIQAETRSLLDSFARRFSDRLDALAQSVEQRSSQRFADLGAANRAANDPALDDIARKLDEHRDEVAGAINILTRRLDAMPAAAADTAAIRNELAELRAAVNGAAGPSAPNVQLADIVRNALAPGGYEFNALLANNRRADCLIRLARPPGPIAIDAQFPVEAFHALHERKSASAENEFRRVTLRHVAGVAERLISPGFTANSALLFLPSESMASELHTRFPDIIQDSYRARVWIVSPTSLMATLHMMSSLLRDAPRRAQSPEAENAARQALSEVERLSARIAALEKGAPAARPDPRDLLSANDASEWRPGDAAPAQADYRDAAEDETPGDLFADDALSDARHQTQARPPFPLR